MVAMPALLFSGRSRGGVDRSQLPPRVSRMRSISAPRYRSRASSSARDRPGVSGKSSTTSRLQFPAAFLLLRPPDLGGWGGLGAPATVRFSSAGFVACNTLGADGPGLFDAMYP